MVKNRNFVKNGNLSKIENLVENRNCGQKQKISLEIEILVTKIENLVENRNFDQKQKFWSEIAYFKQKNRPRFFKTRTHTRDFVKIKKQKLDYKFGQKLHQLYFISKICLNKNY